MENRQKLSEHLVKQLVEYLQQYLHEPAPVGLLGGVQMIVDIAVGLAANLPLESRDVRVWYPLPGSRFESRIMRGEVGLPPLVTPTSQRLDPEGDKSQVDTNQQAQNPEGGETSSFPPPAPAKDDISPAGRAGIGGLPPNKEGNVKKPPVLDRMKGALQRSARGSPGPDLPPAGRQGHQSQQSRQQNGNGGGQVPPPQTAPQQAAPQQIAPQQDPGSPKDGDRVRIAGFMACEVRGKLILGKAPVWL
jgi:hypothetical protein